MKSIFLSIALLLIFSLSFQNQATAQESDNVVLIEEYSDYQCPACAYFHPFTVKIKEDLGDKVKVVYKNFPLNSHRYAQLAARAAEAARKQGKHFEMHDKLFQEQANWARGNTSTLILGYAEEIGLDMTQFKKDLNSAEMQELIMNEKKEGIDRGVNSTPTFFINGDKLYQNPGSYEVFKALVESYMK
jgi:protein-disulfide isomerase